MYKGTIMQTNWHYSIFLHLTFYDTYEPLKYFQKLFIRPYTHLQNKLQCMNNNVYTMYIWVKETPTKTK